MNTIVCSGKDFRLERLAKTHQLQRIQWAILGRRRVEGGTVQETATRIEKALGRAAQRIDDRPGCDFVIGRAVLVIRRRGVDDRVDVPDGAGDAGRIVQIAVDSQITHAGQLGRARLQPRKPHHVMSRRRQSTGDRAADQSCSTRHQYTHVSTSSPVCDDVERTDGPAGNRET